MFIAILVKRLSDPRDPPLILHDFANPKNQLLLSGKSLVVVLEMTVNNPTSNVTQKQSQTHPSFLGGVQITADS